MVGFLGRVGCMCGWWVRGWGFGGVVVLGWGWVGGGVLVGGLGGVLGVVVGGFGGGGRWVLVWW